MKGFEPSLELTKQISNLPHLTTLPHTQKKKLIKLSLNKTFPITKKKQKKKEQKQRKKKI